MGIDQKIPDGLVKTAFLGEVGASLRLVIKLWVNVWPSIRDSVLSLRFSF